MTLSAGSGMEVVSTSDIVTITSDVWSSFLDTDLEQVDDAFESSGELVTGVVAVSGAWRGWIVLECATGTARLVAAAMFLMSPELIRDDDVADALGELANMIGGNVKSLLPAPSRLSLPTVVRDGWQPEPGAGLVNRVAFAAGPGAEPVRITVWEA
jgi:chemotaxis protein CheX